MPKHFIAEFESGLGYTQRNTNWKFRKYYDEKEFGSNKSFWIDAACDRCWSFGGS